MLKKACDTCHVRRAKCSGEQPCSRCERVGSRCTYLKVARKKGPKRRHDSESAWAITDSDRTHVWAEASTESPASIPTLTKSTALATSSPSQHPEAGFLMMIHNLLIEAVDEYIENFYPLMPVINVETLRHRVDQREQLWNRQFAALILSIGAFVAVAKNTEPMEAQVWMEKAACLHASASLYQDITLDTVVTVMTIGSFLRSTDRAALAYVKVQEAMALAETLKLGDSSTYTQYSPEDGDLALRIFWKLSVAVRSHSLVTYSANTVKGSAASLALSTSRLTPIAARLFTITRLFDVAEPETVQCLNGQCNRFGCHFDRTKALNIEKTLAESLDLAGLSAVQIVDALVTRLWLCSRLWQACVSHALLEADAGSGVLFIRYPLGVIHDTLEVLLSYSFEAFEGNGKCMAFKLREIIDTCDLIVSMTPQPFSGDDEAVFGGAKEALNIIRQRSIELEKCKWMRWNSKPSESPTS